MRKVWKTNRLIFEYLDTGIFVFTFQSEANLVRIVGVGPWCFSNHLLILKQWVPSIPSDCYDFNSCNFWVCPMNGGKRRLSLALPALMAKSMKSKWSKRALPPRKMEEEEWSWMLQNAWYPGTFSNYRGKNFWVDFKYERLTHKCYACGKKRHYAKFCQEVLLMKIKWGMLIWILVKIRS